MKKFILFCITFYRQGISPLFPPSCRFTPTCSQYAFTAISRFGVLYGGFLSVKRLLRCHPFCKKCGYDPVPEIKASKERTRNES